LNGALILAAGFSRRFGGDKRQHPITAADGSRQIMLCATAALYAAQFNHTLVVLRPDDEALRQHLLAQLPQVDTAIAKDAHLGMGHSLAAGITVAAGWQYVFVGLADMPFIKPDTLTQLRSTMEAALMERADGVIVQPVFEGQPGHPVGFSSHFFPALLELQGDEGAKSVINQAGEQLQRIPVTDPGVLQDIDRPD
jgi:molybdenum cofactor cytidylyltransferase